MSLLERRPQVEALVAYAAEARAGDGRLVLVAGEAGVGKSTLVEAVESAVRETQPDARWLWGRCDGQFTPRPLGPVVEVAELLGGPAWAAVRLPLDLAEFHTYACDWSSDRVGYLVDGALVRRVEGPPRYPLQLMLAVFDFPDHSVGGDDELVPELVVDWVRGYGDAPGAQSAG